MDELTTRKRSGLDPTAPLGEGGQLTRWNAAQAAVIGSMLIDERCCGEVFQATTPEMFGDATLRHIFEAEKSVWLKTQHLDPIVVMEACGSDSYAETLAEAMRITPTAANVLEYCELCQKCLRLWNFRQAGYELLEAMTAEEADAVWQRLGRQIMGAEKIRCVSLAEAVSGYLDRMNDATPPDTIAFGIPQLDKLLNLRKGKFVILGADSSSGKTALALQIAYHVAASGKKVGFFSLETDNDTLIDRLMAEEQAAGIPLPNSKAHALRRIDYQRATQVGMSPAANNLYLTDSCETLDAIQTVTMSMRFDMIVVDYLQLIDADGDKRWDIVTNISMVLHRMARKLGVTVLGLSQITPKGKDVPLTMDDLRESRQLKHDADVILLLELCNDFPNGRSLTIAKNKDGRRNTGMKLNFDPEHMTFSYYKRVEPSVSGQVEFHELPEGDDEENPF